MVWARGIEMGLTGGGKSRMAGFGEGVVRSPIVAAPTFPCGTASRSSGRAEAAAVPRRG